MILVVLIVVLSNITLPNAAHALSLNQSFQKITATTTTNNNLPRRAFFHKAKAAVVTASTTTASLVLIGTPATSEAITSTNSSNAQGGGPIVRFGEEDIMSPKAHGTTEMPVQEQLKFGVSTKLADKICCYNRHFAENSFSFTKSTWEDELRQAVADHGGKPMTFYDSVTGKPLFTAPIGRSVDDLIDETYKHGWPSFRDAEVVWDNVRVLKNSGETVSVDGTHLGHNLPDRMGNRYCINLCCIAGYPA